MSALHCDGDCPHPFCNVMRSKLALAAENADLRARLATAEALALTNGERADEWERRARNANDEWQSAMRLQGSAMSRASRAEAERDDLRRRLAAALTPYDTATAHALAAVRAERDELRRRLDAAIVLVDDFAACDDSDAELAVIHRLTEWAHPTPTEPDGASETKGPR